MEFSRREPGIQIGAHLGKCHLAHASPKPIPDQRTFIDNCFSFKVLVARERERFTDTVNRLGRLFLVLMPFSRGADDGLGLVAELGGEFPMRRHHLSRGMNLLSIAGRVRGDLCGLGTCPACPFKVFPNLLAPRTRCVEVFLGVALDLRRPTAAGRDFVAELAKPVGQLGLIHRGRELLRRE